MTDVREMNLGQRAEEISKLIEQVNHLSRLEDAARRDTTAARNRLSEAQKAFDLEVNKLRSVSPWSTYWNDSNRSSREVVA